MTIREEQFVRNSWNPWQGSRRPAGGGPVRSRFRPCRNREDRPDGPAGDPLHAAGQNVLHVSLHDPVQKVALWYEELFQDAARRQGMAGAQRLWESLVPHRFIMTFRVDGFSVPRLAERLEDLAAQGIFRPEMVYHRRLSV